MNLSLFISLTTQVILGSEQFRITALGDQSRQTGFTQLGDGSAQMLSGDPNDASAAVMLDATDPQIMLTRSRDMQMPGIAADPVRS